MSCRLADERLAVGQRAVDVGAAAELRAEEHLDRIVQLVGEVDDRGVEDHQARAHARGSEASTAPNTPA